jgi:hypothetical protein
MPSPGEAPRARLGPRSLEVLKSDFPKQRAPLGDAAPHADIASVGDLDMVITVLSLSGLVRIEPSVIDPSPLIGHALLLGLGAPLPGRIPAVERQGQRVGPMPSRRARRHAPALSPRGIPSRCKREPDRQAVGIDPPR